MKAIRVPRAGDSSVLELVDLPIPTPGPGEVLIEIEAAGVNFLDIQQRLDRYPGGVTFPYVAGVEGAGRVAALGPNTSGFTVGDRVAVASVLGCYAEAVCVPVERVVGLSDDIQTRTAAAAMIQAMSACVFTTRTYPVQSGDWVLVHAGAGGTGRMLVQFARRRGAVVVTTVSSAAKAEVARSAGADHVIRYDADDFGETARALPGFPGFAVIYDSVGPTVPQDLPLLRRQGMLVSMGKSGGPIPPLDLDQLNRLGSLYVTRPNAAHFLEEADARRQIADEVFQALREGAVSVLVDRTFALEEAAVAQDLLASRGTMGKLLLIP